MCGETSLFLSICPSFQLSVHLCVSSAGGLHIDPGEGICTCGGNVGLGGVEGHVVNGLLTFLPVSRDLLYARLTIQVPQTQRTVVTCGRGGVKSSSSSVIDWSIDPSIDNFTRKALWYNIATEKDWRHSWTCQVRSNIFSTSSMFINKRTKELV